MGVSIICYWIPETKFHIKMWLKNIYFMKINRKRVFFIKSLYISTNYKFAYVLKKLQICHKLNQKGRYIRDTT